MLHKFLKLTTALIVLASTPVMAQTDGSADDDIDWSLYEDLGFEDESAKRYCSPKIEGLSPAQLITVGYDYQGPYSLVAGTGDSLIGTSTNGNDTANILSTQGIRAGFNIPVISKTNILWQMGAGYWRSGYSYETDLSGANPVHQTLAEHGLHAANVNTTIFKPLDDKQFLLFQGSAGLNGSYGTNLMSANYLKYSAALLWGRRPTEKKQWGVGLARTYRAGELNFIPVILYNSTDAQNRWGAEVLFPARAHVRRTINSRNMILFGYELQGQSNRLYRAPDGLNQEDWEGYNLELRRSEARIRAIYQYFCFCLIGSL